MMFAVVMLLPHLVLGRPTSVTCSRALTVGAPFMGTPSITAIGGQEMQFTRADGTGLPCGGTYTVGEELTARLLTGGSTFCYLLEIQGGTFGPGTFGTTCRPDCGDSRCVMSSMDDGTPIPVTAVSPDKMTLKGAFAPGFGTVQITEVCEVFAEAVVEPSPVPSAPPTGAPTPMPSPQPSPMPTPCPTIF